MDHDSLLAVGAPGDIPHPARPIDGMRKDEDWIRGDPIARGEFACLKEIYRISPAVEALGAKQFEAQVIAGFTATRHAMAGNDAVAAHFDRDYWRTLTLRDEAIRDFLERGDSDDSLDAWKQNTRMKMSGTLYSDDWISGLCGAIVRNRRTLSRYRFLYDAR
jgi:hypothetical protein